jgi:two-component system sensor kinase FixL
MKTRHRLAARFATAFALLSTSWKRHGRSDGTFPVPSLSGRAERGEATPHLGRYTSVGPLIGMGALGVMFLAVVLLQTWCWTCRHIDDTAGRQAHLAVEFGKALRDYVGKNIRPEMEKRVNQGEFIPEAMSTSFVARSVLEDVRTAFPDTILRFASLNPRNPANRALPAEKSLIQYFEQHPESEVWSGTMEFFQRGEKYFVCAIPRRFEASCLQCHGRPADAPAALLERYGAVAGFGRSIGEVSVDLAAIPVSASYAAARAQVLHHMLIALGLCLLFLSGVAFLIGADARRRRSAERAVETERNFLRLVIDAIPAFVCVKSRDGRYVIANEALANAYGTTVQGVEGRCDADFSPTPEQVERERRDELEVIATGKAKRIAEEPLTYADGTTHWLTTTKVPLVREDGRCDRLLAVATDITERRRVEEALRMSEERLRRTLDAAQTVAWEGDLYGEALIETGPVADLFGLAPDAMRTDRAAFVERIHPEDRDRVLAAIQSGAAGADTYEIAYRVLLPDGGVRWIQATGGFDRDSDGRAVRARGIARDITAQKQAQEELHRERDRAQRYLDIADVMLLVLDETGRITLINRKGSQILGYEQQELLGRKWFETCLPVSAQEKTHEVFGQLMAGEIKPAEYVEGPVRTRSGTERVVAWHNAILKDDAGRIVGTLSSGEDITERKLAEQRRSELLDRLAQINQELRDFAYIISHDLKAPLRAIRTLADWLVADYQDKLDEQGRENLQLLSGRVDRMQNLIDGVLQYSRVGRTEQGTAPIDLQRLVPEIIDDLGIPAHVTIRVESELPTVEADVTRITQVFQNLLSNAIKYLDKPRGEIVVGCEEQDGFWKFRVTDNGPGIAQKDFERIFKLFQTLAPREDGASTGVGLTVTKKIVEMYGGRIWVESEVGAGSTFFFTLPQARRTVAAEKFQPCAAT